MSNRRLFLQQSLTLAGGMAASSLMGRSPHVQKLPTVVVLGAGIAGLSAAYTLANKGAAVTVLEARGRLGGRIFSYAPPEAGGLVMELGAEWIGEDHTTLRAMCERFKLPLLDNRFAIHQIDRGAYKPAGAWHFSPEWQERWKKLLKEFDRMSKAELQQLDEIDFYHYLVAHGCTGSDLEWIELNDSTEFGESIRHVSAYMAMSGHAAGGEHAQMDYKVKGGNGALIEALANAVGQANILKGCKVVKVVQSQEGVKVFAADGRVFTADKLICAIPTFALRQINWQPGLPPAMMQALNSVNYGRINKHALLYSKRFWKDEDFAMVTDMPAHLFYHATKNQPGDAGILISYSIGDKAAIFGSYAQQKIWPANAAAEALQPAFGDTRPYLQQQWNYDWSTDEFSKGGYAVYDKYQWFKLQPVLKTPFMHTHFAGEHLHDWQGFMEGAAMSGMEAAEALL
jgi:monoamine oxidase